MPNFTQHIPGSGYVGDAYEYVFPPDPDADSDDTEGVNLEDCYTLYRN